MGPLASIKELLLATTAITALASLQTVAAQTTPQSRNSEVVTEEIVVTATRREERLSRVPISVAAYSQERMDQQGVKSIDDISRLTPGVTFARGDARNASASSIAIRGISSAVAASTTGIYIDDTPIQTRIIGAGASNFNTYPSVFDLDRVEVLRGPQGTLFGAGSEGGTIRFITPKPGYSNFSAYARGEAAFTESGGPSYEAGVALGGPIVAGKVGFRLSAWSRRDGGFIDRVNTDPRPGDAPYVVLNAPVGFPPVPDTDAPTVIPRRDRANFVVEKNSNYQDSSVVKGAIGFVPRDELEIVASVYYQKIDTNDTNAYWEHLSDPDDSRYQQGNALGQPGTDEFWLPSLGINWDLGPVRLVSSSSYFDRDQQALNDYTAFESSLWAGYWEFPVGMFAPTTQSNKQQTWTQEVRLESTNTESWLKWVAGAFYQHTRQESKQFVEDTFLPDLYQDSTGCDFTDPPPAIPPFVGLPCNFPFHPGGPGPHGFGQPLVSGLYTFAQDPVIAHDEQLAGFAQIDVKPFDKLTLTAGVRYAQTKFDATAHYSGPVVGPPVDDSGEKTEYPLTPKFGVSLQATDDNLLYATAAKGFRVGGYNPQVGLPCGPLLGPGPGGLGYLPGPGNPTGRPPTFESDSLWSYEVGTKNSLGNGRAQLNASAYYIDWDNIQQGVFLATCGFGFTTNLGRAVSQGFDLEASFRITDNLTLGTAVGYNDAEFQETVGGGPGGAVPPGAVPLVSEGDKIAGSPWVVTASGQYDFSLMETDAFVRVDYEYHSEGPDNTVALNLANRSPLLPPADPRIFVPTPATNLLSMRAGTQIGNANVSVFVRNLLNDNPNLGRADLATNPVPFGTDAHNYTGQTLRPRTVGMTVTYRY